MITFQTETDLKQNVDSIGGLYQRFGEDLYEALSDLASSLSLSDDDTLDVIQDTFLYFLDDSRKQKISNQKNSHQSYQLILLKSRDLLINKYKQSVPCYHCIDENIADPSSQKEESDNSQLVELLNKEIDSLPNNQKDIFRMYFNEGLTYKEIGAYTNLDRHVVSNIVNSSKKVIADSLIKKGLSVDKKYRI